MSDGRRGWSDKDMARHILSNGTDLDKEIYADLIDSVNARAAREEENSGDLEKRSGCLGMVFFGGVMVSGIGYASYECIKYFIG